MEAPPSDPITQVLKLEAVPGYRRIFLLLLLVAALYLGLILAATPGEKAYHGDAKPSSTHDDETH